MAYHPVNLAFRFILELAALVSLVVWALSNFEAVTAFIMAFIMPLMFMLVWGIFAVKGDKSRSGKTIISTPGPIRLLLELSLFGFSAWALYDSGYHLISLFFLSGIVLHYLLSLKRIRWLIRS